MLSENFLEVIPLAMREIRRELRASRELGLTVPQFRILAHLWRFKTNNNKTLAEDLGVSVAAMSRMVQTLVAEDLVERENGTSDRREVRVALSKKGVKVYEAIRERTRKRITQKFEMLSKEERLSLSQGLEALQKALMN